MTVKPTNDVKPIRLMIRVHIKTISPYEVPDIQTEIQQLVSGYPDAEVETTMLPLLPNR